MKRAERVEELIREEVSDILREKVFDPRIGFVSITAVKISSDFKNASIYVSVFGEEREKKETMGGLISATGFIQHELSQMLQLRVTPKLRFVRDDSLERGSRVLSIINKLKHEADLRKNKKRSEKS